MMRTITITGLILGIISGPLLVQNIIAQKTDTEEINQTNTKLKYEIARAQVQLEQDKICLKIEQEKQLTIRKQAELDSYYGGIFVRSLKAIAWPTAAAIIGCFTSYIAVSQYFGLVKHVANTPSEKIE